MWTWAYTNQVHTIQPPPFPPKLVECVVVLEFVGMSELRIDVWPEEFSPGERTSAGFRRPLNKLPITDIRIWNESYR